MPEHAVALSPALGRPAISAIDAHGCLLRVDGGALVGEVEGWARSLGRTLGAEAEAVAHRTVGQALLDDPAVLNRTRRVRIGQSLVQVGAANDELAGPPHPHKAEELTEVWLQTSPLGARTAVRLLWCRDLVHAGELLRRICRVLPPWRVRVLDGPAADHLRLGLQIHDGSWLERTVGRLEGKSGALLERLWHGLARPALVAIEHSGLLGLVDVEMEAIDRMAREEGAVLADPELAAWLAGREQRRRFRPVLEATRGRPHRLERHWTPWSQLPQLLEHVRQSLAWHHVEVRLERPGPHGCQVELAWRGGPAAWLVPSLRTPAEPMTLHPQDFQVSVGGAVPVAELAGWLQEQGWRLPFPCAELLSGTVADWLAEAPAWLAQIRRLPLGPGALTPRAALGQKAVLAPTEKPAQPLQWSWLPLGSRPAEPVAARVAIRPLKPRLYRQTVVGSVAQIWRTAGHLARQVPTLEELAAAVAPDGTAWLRLGQFPRGPAERHSVDQARALVRGLATVEANPPERLLSLPAVQWLAWEQGPPSDPWRIVRSDAAGAWLAEGADGPG